MTCLSPLLPSSLFALPRSPKFTHLSLEQGLSQTSVSSILQDRRGFMWFGTLDGLNKYDGYTFTVYKRDRQDPHSLSSNAISVLYEDRRDTLWVGTLQGGGLHAYDREQDRWIRYQHDPANAGSLSHDDVYAIVEDRSGTLWVGTAQGLNACQSSPFECTRYLNDDGADGRHHIRALYEDSQGTFWVGTTAGLYTFNRETGELLPYQHDSGDSAELPRNDISVIYEDRQRILWIGTSNGLGRLNPDSGQFSSYYADAANPNSLSFNTITAIFEDSQGALWIGTHGKGLNLYDREHDRFVPVQHDSQEPAGLSSNLISALYVNRNGLVWIGTNGGGLNIYDRDQEQFRHFRHHPQNANSLSHNQVKAIYEDSTGLLWIGTYGGGLNAYDPTADEFFLLPLDPDESGDVRRLIVRAIYEDHTGAMWFGTAAGLFLLDPETGEFLIYTHDPNDPHSISHNTVNIVYEDPAQNLWIGTAGGLNAFDRTTQQFVRDFPAERLSSDYILALFSDSFGTLWVGTYEGGLIAFAPQDEEFAHYRADLDDAESLSHNTVTAIHEDRAGRFWVATGGGLNRLNRASRKFRSYTQQDGLPNDVIYGILEDDAGNLWLSTNQGISKFTPDTETFRNYDVRDGLQSNEFNGGAFHKGHDGEMFFGGINGFNAFYPDQIQDNPHPPEVVLTDFQLFNTPVQPRSDDGSLLQRTITETGMVTLSYKDYVVSFEFTGLHFASPEQNQYAYRLEGFEEEWNYTDADRRFVTYTNLPSGRFTLRVKASNSDGVWDEDGVALTLLVRPPPWETWWAYTSYALTLLGSVVGYVRYKQAKFERKQRELREQRDLLEKLVKERTASLRQRNEELSLLHRVSEMFNAELEWNHVLETGLQEIQKLLKITSTSFWLRLPDSDELVCQHATGPMKEKVVGWKLDADAGFTAKTAQTGQPMLVGDIQIEAEHYKELDAITGVELHSLLSLPMRVKGQVIGVLNLLDDEKDRFVPEMLQLLESITASAGSAIENARLYRLAQEQREAAEEARAEAEEARSKILESIRYAQMIQRSLLPVVANIQAQLPHSFFLWRPRDIVGGDIYFIEFMADGFVLAVIDCTGHGVPGALTSMIAASGMRRIVQDGGCCDPAMILQRLNTIVKTTLRQDTDDAESDDGLDAAVCYVQPEHGRLTFSGAKLPLYYLKNEEVTVIKGDKQSVGYKRSDLSYQFTNRTIDIEPGMKFYLSSDGFVDQGGGPKGFSLGKKRFSKLLVEQNRLPFLEQQENLWQAFNAYMGDHIRVDDVTVVGFEVSENMSEKESDA